MVVRTTSTGVEVTQKTGQSCVFKRLQNTTEESASLIGVQLPQAQAGGSRAWGTEVENALKPKCFLVCFPAARGMRRRG